MYLIFVQNISKYNISNKQKHRQTRISSIEKYYQGRKAQADTPSQTETYVYCLSLLFYHGYRLISDYCLSGAYP